MIPEIGQFALILALAIALVQAVVPLIGAARRDQAWIALAKPAAAAQFLFVALAFAALTWCYVVSDFSVVNVATNSHTLKPMLYKVSGVWGNHEGSILLWVLILALFGLMVALFGRNLPPAFQARVLSVQAMIAVGFLAFSLLTSNPFARLDPPPIDGNGLNPLLQDPGLAFHPPFLYLGYVGFSMAFSFAIAALIEGRVDPAWARWVRPWTLAAWSCLTLGIAMGSWWAYYELGWGGWWFWDPVENASFMPWLLGTALLHSAIVAEKRDALKSWTVLLAILTFSLSLLGTFLVRSGVLTSVHAFATDPARGIFILIFLGIVTGGALLLYAIRAPQLKTGGLFAPMSREGSLVLNNLLLSTACATVFVGTLYPLFLDALSGEKVSVGPPYFNGTFAPLMVPLLVAMAIGPLLAWKRGDLRGALQRLWLVAAVAGLAGLTVLYMANRNAALGAAGTALAAWIVGSTLVELAERIRLFRTGIGDSLRRLAHLPRAAWGMTIAHSGMGIVVVGIAASTAWQTEVLQSMRQGETIKLANYDITFDGVRDVRGPNYTARRGTFRVAKDGQVFVTLEPEARRYPQPPMETTEAAIYPMLSADLYLTVGESDGRGGYAVRLYHKPLVSWIWAGAIVMVLGGVVSLTDRRHRVGLPRRAKGQRLAGNANPTASPAE